MNQRLTQAAIYLSALPVLAASLLVGPAEAAGPRETLAWLLGWLSRGLPAPLGETDRLMYAIVMDVRLPRALLTFLVGLGLSSSGAALQAVFRNPLVDPYILGLASGAAMGAALSVWWSWLPLQPSAFAGGLLAVGLSYLLSLNRGQSGVVGLVLAGVIVSGLFTAGLTVVQFLADPFKLQTIVHWTMGNLHNASWARTASAAGPALLGAGVLVGLGWWLNVLALGDEEARASGVNPEWLKVMVVVPATLTAAAVVAVAGVIGLVGLATPHMVRLMLGPDNRRLIPATAVFGGVFLLLVDDFSRALFAFEIPIGVFTTIIGGPFFFYLLRRSRLAWSE